MPAKVQLKAKSGKRAWLVESPSQEEKKKQKVGVGEKASACQLCGVKPEDSVPAKQSTP